jgi:PAS domain S-box-containing protein
MTELGGPAPDLRAAREGGGSPEPGTAEGIVDARGFVTRWSSGAQQLLGYSAEQVVGHPAARLLASPLSRSAVLSALRAHPERWSGHLMLRHKAGHSVSVLVIAHHHRGPDVSEALDGSDGREALDVSDASDSADTLVAASSGPVDSNFSTGYWRFVCPLEGREPLPSDDDLARWAFEQLPRCAVSIYDTDLRYRRSNQAMAPVVGLSDDAVRGLGIHDITTQPQTVNLADGLRRALSSGEPYHLESFQRTGGERRIHAWSVDFGPLKSPDGTVHGVGLVAHDTTEQYWARKRLVLLNEAASRIGSTLDLGQTASELLEVTVPELADFGSVDLLTALETESELADGALPERVTLRRVSHRFAPGTLLPTVVELGAVDSYPEFSPPARALATGAGVLSGADDPAYARWMRVDSVRDARIREQGYHSMMAVPLRARGTTLGVAVLYRRVRQDRMEPFDHDDLLLAEELAARAAVAIDNARRYTRERDAALSLQRSLLPQHLPEQGAVQVATRYIPAGAQSGIGGDWFDVIPLSGARVALIVGDVVGHGIHASATMGRLRTAVRTLADVDLPPDELLTHLDDLVIRLSADTEAADHSGETGATCCYAVYDPISRTCTLASAGHPPPVILLPDGTATTVRIPVGPPLGIGGLPFEATDIELAEGSLLTLYSDGLIETRDRDIDEGIEQLCRVLEQADPPLEKICDTVLDGLLTGRPQDDVALLVARPRGLDDRHVATWDIPPDPVAVAQARKGVAERLAAWGLPDVTYSTELIASELVTNAIRYADPPIGLRLIYDRTLICEVTDASSTAPHLRRARAFDEGGRGLMLVAQMAHRWGTRHTLNGKTIWAEQTVMPS